MDYPGLISHGSGANKVHGTLFEVSDPDAVFPIMDEHEGFTPGLSAAESRQRNYYERVETDVTLDADGTTVRAEVYALNRDADYFKSDFIEEVGPVPGGDWLEYLKKLVQGQKKKTVL